MWFYFGFLATRIRGIGSPNMSGLASGTHGSGYPRLSHIAAIRTRPGSCLFQVLFSRNCITKLLAPTATDALVSLCIASIVVSANAARHDYTSKAQDPPIGALSSNSYETMASGQGLGCLIHSSMCAPDDVQCMLTHNIDIYLQPFFMFGSGWERLGGLVPEARAAEACLLAPCEHTRLAKRLWHQRWGS
jgi:hypothetical protein